MSGEIHTPSIDSGILEGITRDAVIELARAAGYSVTERTMDRHDVFTADECFLTGHRRRADSRRRLRRPRDRYGPARADHPRASRAVPSPGPRRAVSEAEENQP